MAERLNVALFDSTWEEARDFIKGLEESTGLEWKAEVFTANQGRKNKLANIIRYIKYFVFPFKIFLKRKSYDQIIGWQAFYGLLFAFYCRLFGVKKQNVLLIKNLIYKPKKGIAGKIYYAFMRYIIKSKYVDVFVCSSQRFCDYCARVFDEPRDRFVFIPFGINDFCKTADGDKDTDGDYVLALGRSNRDWDFAIESFADTEYKVRIVCDELHRENLPQNIKIYNNVWAEESHEFIRNCKFMFIPIKDGDIVAGETVLLLAMSFSKPIVITKPSCLADDYVTHNKTGLIAEKTRQDVLAAAKKIYSDDEFYKELARNSRKLYEERHSLYSFGINVGKVLSERRI